MAQQSGRHQLSAGQGIFHTRSTPRVVDTPQQGSPLVWLNRFVDNRVMDARQAACW